MMGADPIAPGSPAVLLKNRRTGGAESGWRSFLQEQVQLNLASVALCVIDMRHSSALCLARAGKYCQLVPEPTGPTLQVCRPLLRPVLLRHNPAMLTMLTKSN